MKIDYNIDDDIFDLLEDNDEAEEILEQLRNRGVEYTTQFENNEIFINVEHNNDYELEQLQDSLNELIETIHYGYDYCDKCNEYSLVEYGPAERNHYSNTIQLCDCGRRMSRKFGNKQDIEEESNLKFN